MDGCSANGKETNGPTGNETWSEMDSNNGDEDLDLEMNQIENFARKSELEELNDQGNYQLDQAQEEVG